MVAIPTREPTAAIAGDTVAWRREDLATDFPASAGWALTYAFRNASAKIDVTASASGDAFAVSVAAATTAAWVPGTYGWTARVAKGAEAYTIDSGTFTVQPNLATSDVRDLRRHAERMLEAIEARLEGRASTDQDGYRIGDRELRRIPIPELVKLRDRYRQEVKAALAAEALARGTGRAAAVYVRL
jgi:hypothetical protein